jgi:hypothetical protein
MYKTGKELLIVRDQDAFTRYLRLDLPNTPPGVAGHAIPQESEAIAGAKQWFARLGLPLDEALAPESHGVAAAGTTPLGPVAPVVVSRLVEFGRTVNGLRVGDSFARFEFGQDGELRSVLVHWPSFRLRPGVSTLRDPGSVQQEIQAWSAGRPVSELHLVYLQDADGYMVPGISATAEVGAAGFFPVVE